MLGRQKEERSGLVEFSAFTVFLNIAIYVARFRYGLRQKAFKEPDSRGTAIYPKPHLSTSKRKVTSRLALKVYVKTRAS